MKCRCKKKVYIIDGTNYIVFLLFVPYLFYELSCGDDDIVINHPWMLFRLSAVVTNLSSSTTTLNSSRAYSAPPLGRALALTFGRPE
jgi:hypothetical protein